jgi:hypothetical protein
MPYKNLTLAPAGKMQVAALLIFSPLVPASIPDEDAFFKVAFHPGTATAAPLSGLYISLIN